MAIEIDPNNPPKSTKVEESPEVTDDDVARALRRFRDWARDNEPEYANLLDAEVVSEDDGDNA